MLSTKIQSVYRHQWISEAAYFLAEANHFNPNSTLNNWLEAEIAYSEMLIADYLVMLEEDNEPLTAVGLKRLATAIGVNYADQLVSKSKIVQAIQNTLQHRPCFHGEDHSQCQELECQWRSECQRLTAVWASQ